MFNGLEPLKNHFLWPDDKISEREWRWEGTDTRANYELAKQGKFKTLYNENSFTYTVNSHFFRSGEFLDIDITKPIFAVGGDSLTFGIGLPLEDTWGYQVYLMLKAEFPTTQFVNLGMGGTSIDYSARILSCVGDLSQHFDCYMNLLTNVTRRELAHENLYLFPFLHAGHISGMPNKPTHEIVSNYAKTFGIDDVHIKFNVNKHLVIMDLIARLNKFTMILDFWNDEYSLIPGFERQVDLVEPQFMKYFTVDRASTFYAPVPPDIPEELVLARDGYHPGIYLHTRYAQSIYPQVKQKFLESITAKNKKVE